MASRELETPDQGQPRQPGRPVANLITIGQVTTARVDGIQQLLVTYPDVVAGGYTVVPGDGTAHFGLALAHDPPVCTQGYGGTARRQPQDTGPAKVNTSARCTAPRGSTTSVRGAQNAPGPSGTRSARAPRCRWLSGTNPYPRAWLPRWA